MANSNTEFDLDVWMAGVLWALSGKPLPLSPGDTNSQIDEANGILYINNARLVKSGNQIELS